VPHNSTEHREPGDSIGVASNEGASLGLKRKSTGLVATGPCRHVGADLVFAQLAQRHNRLDDGHVRLVARRAHAYRGHNRDGSIGHLTQHRLQVMI